MEQSEPRAQQRPVLPVKAMKRIGRVIAETADQPLAQARIHPWRTQPLAFEAEKGDLVEGIHEAQFKIEFERIDDCRRLGEADMLGPQIAMPLDDMPFAHARFQFGTHLFERRLEGLAAKLLGRSPVRRLERRQPRRGVPAQRARTLIALMEMGARQADGCDARH